jgi:hypothetical protein
MGKFGRQESDRSYRHQHGRDDISHAQDDGNDHQCAPITAVALVTETAPAAMCFASLISV